MYRLLVETGVIQIIHFETKLTDIKWEKGSKEALLFRSVFIISNSHTYKIIIIRLLLFPNNL